ncbi:MAG: hypothetical protein GY845_31060 [Planctomycetes bacterium]|nr:hypothetical protein [Planctomycetota bacterium]
MGNTKSSSDAACVKLITPKGIIRFFCLFLLAFGLLMAPWPRLGRAYTRFYSTGAAFLFGSVGAKGTVRFEPLSDSEYDLHVTLYNRAHIGPDGNMIGLKTRHNSRHAGYMYAAFLTALIIATPIPARRKVWALFLGFILIHGLVASKLGLRIFYTFNHEPLSMFTLDPFFRRVLSITHQAFAVNVTFGFIVCVFIWILVSFPRRDWARIQGFYSKEKKKQIV